MKNRNRNGNESAIFNYEWNTMQLGEIFQHFLFSNQQMAPASFSQNHCFRNNTDSNQ